MMTCSLFVIAWKEGKSLICVNCPLQPTRRCLSDDRVLSNFSVAESSDDQVDNTKTTKLSKETILTWSFIDCVCPCDTCLLVSVRLCIFICMWRYIKPSCTQEEECCLVRSSTSLHSLMGGAWWFHSFLHPTNQPLVAVCCLCWSSHPTAKMILKTA